MMAAPSPPSATVTDFKAHGVAKLENGYTRMANELLEALVSSPFSPSQLRVVLAIARLTYGYRKRTAAISTKKIAAICGMKLFLAQHAVANLIIAQVLFREGGQRGDIGINNHIDQWRFAPSTEAVSLQKSANSKVTQFAEISKLSLQKSANSTAEISKLTPTTHYIGKENFKEEEKESEKTSSTPSVDISINALSMQIVAAWNRERPRFAITPILPPKRQAQMKETIEFVMQCLGYEKWPNDMADIPAWFADFFASIENGDQDGYLKDRDFGFFMDSDRLFNALEGFHATRP